MEYVMKTINTMLFQFTFMLSICGVTILNNIYPMMFKIYPYGTIIGFIGGSIVMINVLYSKTIKNPMIKTWSFCLFHSLIISSLFNRHNDFVLFGKSVVVFLLVLMSILMIISHTIDHIIGQINMEKYRLKPINKNIINMNLIIYTLVRLTKNTNTISELFYILDIVFLIVLVFVMVFDMTYFLGKSEDMIYSGSNNRQNNLYVNQTMDMFIIMTHIFIRICTIMEY